MAEDRGGWAPLEPEDEAGAGAGPSRPPSSPPPGASPSGWGPPPGGYQWARPDHMPKAGDARTGPLPLHPMNLSDVLDGAFKLYKANFRTVVAITAAFVVPLQLVAAFAQRNLLGGRGFMRVINDPSVAQTTSEQRSNAQTVIVLVSTLLLLLVTPFVAGAISRVVAGSYLGADVDAGSALRATGRRWWALTAAWILVHLVEAVGFVLCILPGLLAMALFVATAPAIVTEELGPVAGMRRSARLVRPRVFGVLGVALLAGFLASVLGSVLGVVPQTAALFVGLRWGWPLLALGSILTSLVTTPFVAIVATLLYFDGRIRGEGLDLQIMAAELARTPSA